ncbi:hypothetical protein BS1321_26585 [Peribacillus simplex NBRC 15720 = DSM 1321]|uniref:Uncharacterized protein n=1 Tax=Peribacillus simplex NBRC 15720 = DSM 1321 TaxID=1349754 RepID=A0A223EPG9_9BACI|nr:hypothetical protein BS1321_26585 [Peribacillus simplex NBRC 15720 = DSM 1321]
MGGGKCGVVFDPPEHVVESRFILLMGVKQSGYYWTEEMAQKLRNNSQFFSKVFFKSTKKYYLLNICLKRLTTW